MSYEPIQIEASSCTVENVVIHSPGRRELPPVPMEIPGIVKDGWKFGVMLAMVLSWSVHHSIAWAIVQGLAGWVYVIYYAVMH